MATDGSATSGATQNPITAVDIVLEPDATMIQNAQAANAGLLKNFPKGYALGDEHAPHISVIGGYFYTANLDEVFAGASKVLASEKVMSWKLKAFKYYYIPLKEIGLGGILVEPTADLIRLQDELFDIAGADGIRTGHQRRAGRRALSFWGEVEEHHALFGEGIDATFGFLLRAVGGFCFGSFIIVFPFLHTTVYVKTF
jgi:hypothetical protein